MISIKLNSNNNYKLPYLNLGTKFIITIVVILAVTMSISAFYIYNIQYDISYNNLIKQSKFHANFVANTSTESILTQDYITLNNNMKNLSQLNDIVYSYISSPDDELMTSYIDVFDPYILKLVNGDSKIKLKELVPKLKVITKLSHLQFPVKLDDEVIAKINIGIDHSRLQGIAKNTLITQLYSAAAIIFALSIFIYIVFHSSVLIPIRRLILGAERIANGDLSTNVDISTNDEFGSLTKTFNEMMSKLKESIKKRNSVVDDIRNLNTNLENIVQERTANLEELNTTLENKVAERTARLELAQKIAAMGYWDYSINQRFIIASNDVYHIMGLATGVPVSRYQFLKIVHPQDKKILIKAYSDAIHFKKILNIKIRILHPDGEIRTVIISAQKSIISNQEQFFGIIQDVTERENATVVTQNALLDKSNAESANDAKSSFLANMSHEIRTPLTAIIGFSEVLVSSSDKNSDGYDLLTTIFNNAQHLLEVINEILDLSKIESEKLNIEILPTNLINVVEDVANVMKLQADEKKLDFKIDYYYPLPELIETDPVRFKQILLNLVGNAIKFTESGQITISIKLIDNHKIQASVKDSGIGIGPESIKKLFTPFTQADATTTRKYGGTGLGLYISKKLIELLGGKIEIQSIVDLGTKIEFELDIGNFNENNLITARSFEAKKNTEIIINPDIPLVGSLLIVDDSPDNIKLIKLLLADQSIEISTANNGKQAIEIANDNIFDLILMDMQMPIMNGMDAIKYLRDNAYTFPIIALTANAMPEDVEKYLAIGCDGFLSKPIDRKNFYATLSLYLTGESKKVLTFKSKKIKPKDTLSFRKLTSEFIVSLTERITLITDSIENRNYQIAISECHKLKGIAGAFGFPEITDCSAVLESQLKNREYDKINFYLRNLTILVESSVLDM